MNRLSRVFLAGLVIASSLIMPVGAWDKYSFVGDSVYFSGQDTVLRPPAVLAEEESSYSWDFGTLASHMSTSTLGAALVEVFHEGQPGDGLIPDIPDWTEARSYPTDGEAFTPLSYSGSGNRNWDIMNLDLPSSLNGGEVESILGIVFSPFVTYVDPSRTFIIDVDISSLGDFSVFELSGLLRGQAGITNGSGTSWIITSGIESVGIYVNGALRRTVYATGSNLQSVVDFADSVFSVTGTVDSLQLYVKYRSFSSVSPDSVSSFRVRVGLFGSSTLSLDVLNGDSALDGFTDDAKDQINDWDSIESEFGDDATEGFNGLDLDNFTYPSDFLAAFSLVSGIFTDLWNCMGDFQIIYLLPLTLGICLLLVGRVSRSSVPSPPPLHTDLPVSNSLGPPSRPALKGGKR